MSLNKLNYDNEFNIICEIGIKNHLGVKNIKINS